ncbi:ubiquinol-cytochrome c reductase, cytochrome c1 subunit [Paracoccus aminophilus JCM 7686]|uniref:Cytochrome c1 n=1 Tax=Paracoccus aminophilus JCM 7686 TaxID=1367847 RepID=S5YF52_PARAH|nr:ubiquinol-cytochrome c reductase, cytochrome c1 subunit [Paracoccus aminophilus JCM 7686]
MTLRNVSLTAVAALTVALAGGAMAQDSSTAQGTTAPAGSSYHSGQTAAPAAEAPAAPAAEEAKPAEAAAPAAEAAKPAEAAAPAAEEAKPAEAAAPAAEEAKPAEAAAPAAEEAKPAEAAAPAAEEAKPAEAAAPAAEAAKPAEAAAPAAEKAHEPAADAHAAPHIEDVAFSFEGPFGTYDQFQLQRGLQVYTEVCSACHGLTYVPLRTLGDAGGPQLPADQVRAYAANLSINDPETGEERPRLPTDHFPTIHGEGMGPDLSLMAKARAGFHGPYGTGLNQLFHGIGGPEYIHAVLTGFNGESKEEAGHTLYHNAAFPGGWIGMPPPLSEGQVTYEDGTEATVDQMSQDVSAFLMWTAEPKMMDRKQVGFISVLFLIVLASLLYMTNKRLWWNVKHRGEEKH